MRTSASAKIQKLIAEFEPQIRNAFLESIQDIADNAILSDIVRALEDGDIVRAVNALGLDDAAFRPLISTIERAFETGGIATGKTFPKRINTEVGRVVFRFDVRNSRAEAWLRDKSSSLVTSIAEDTRATVRQAMQRGMQAGTNPRTTALDVVGRINPATGRREGGLIGLTPGQERWASNARRELESLDSNYFSRTRRDKRFDSIVKKAIDSGKPLDKATVDKLVGRYKDSLLKYRGDVIGRTESISALNQSEQEAILQAVDKGAIRENQVRRVWDSAGNDGRTRETHLMMEGQTVSLNQPFTFPDGSLAMFPGDSSLGAPGEEIIQCRCVARTVIDWLADARNVMSEDDRQALLALSDDELFGGR